MPTPGKTPYDAYKKTEINTANQGTLIVMMYDGAIKFLNIARDHMASPKTYDVANTNIIKAQDIITELLLSLNLDEKNEIAHNLFSLYMYFKKRLLEANIKKDPAIIDEVVRYLKELREAWSKISATESKTDKTSIEQKGSFNIEG
ncbi:MAG: flagellar export chaperone FliS [Spirochaetes bacterium]|nr:flagellar export chaperone FliS [Spirochaetota bacterium]